MQVPQEFPNSSKYATLKIVFFRRKNNGWWWPLLQFWTLTVAYPFWDWNEHPFVLPIEDLLYPSAPPGNWAWKWKIPPIASFKLCQSEADSPFYWLNHWLVVKPYFFEQEIDSKPTGIGEISNLYPTTLMWVKQCHKPPHVWWFIWPIYGDFGDGLLLF